MLVLFLCPKLHSFCIEVTKLLLSITRLETGWNSCWMCCNDSWMKWYDCSDNVSKHPDSQVLCGSYWHFVPHISTYPCKYLFYCLPHLLSNIIGCVGHSIEFVVSYIVFVLNMCWLSKHQLSVAVQKKMICVMKLRYMVSNNSCAFVIAACILSFFDWWLIQHWF